jgi:hypothetical protein
MDLFRSIFGEGFSKRRALARQPIIFCNPFADRDVLVTQNCAAHEMLRGDFDGPMVRRVSVGRNDAEFGKFNRCEAEVCERKQPGLGLLKTCED